MPESGAASTVMGRTSMPVHKATLRVPVPVSRLRGSVADLWTSGPRLAEGRVTEVVDPDRPAFGLTVDPGHVMGALADRDPTVGINTGDAATPKMSDLGQIGDARFNIATPLEKVEHPSLKEADVNRNS
jgi:hypothetical protein